MFTGIVQAIAQVKSVKPAEGTKQIRIELAPAQMTGLVIGASVSVDGVCLTVAAIEKNVAVFDVIQETLEKTTLKEISADISVNIERAAKYGDEIGGHLISGHIFDTAKITDITRTSHNVEITFKSKPEWAKYLFPKGYIAIDGISLTLVEVNLNNTFSVHLIPETLRATTLGKKHVGNKVNIEIDAQTQAIVTTIERIDGRSPLYDRPA